MNNLMRKALLISACVMTVPGVMAQMANKTFFTARNEHQQGGRAWAMSAPHKMNQTVDSRFGLTANALVFYSESDNKAGLGQYFGAASRTDLSDANATVEVKAGNTATTNALHGRDVDHTYDTADTPMSGTMKLAPWQKRYGVDLGFGLDLGKMFKNLSGWHLRAQVPVVEVTNNMGVTFESTAVAVDDGGDSSKTVNGTIDGFFAGTYSQSAPAQNTQDALAFGKVSTADRKKSGVADVKLALSYDFAAEHDSAACVHGGVIIPAGNRTTAVDMFEAIHGNNRHVGAFVGGEGSFRVWQNARKGMSLWLSGTAEYTFLFQGREKRVAGLYDSDTSMAKTLPWGHAMLGVQEGVQKVFPLANVFARDMYVTPGSHLDGVLGVTLAWKKLNLNFGYNFFYKQSENVRLAGDWPLDTYGRAVYQFATNYSVADTAAGRTSGMAGSGAVDFGGTSVTQGPVDIGFDDGTTDNDDATQARHAVGPIQTKAKTTSAMRSRDIDPTNSTSGYLDTSLVNVRYHIDPSAAAGSDQQTHTLLGSANFSCKFRRMHVDLGFGGSWEIASDDSKALEGWNLFGKFSVRI